MDTRNIAPHKSGQKNHDQSVKGNKIIINGIPYASLKYVTFNGSNNILCINSYKQNGNLEIIFCGDNASCTIGASPRLQAQIKLGEHSSIYIGDDVSSTTTMKIVAMERAKISIGQDCMFSSGNKIWAGDFHPIYDVFSKKRINKSRDITIGEHVWLGTEAHVLSGVSIGNGAVVGEKAVVTKTIPNNSLAVGVPARVVKYHISWERTNLLYHSGQIDHSQLEKSKYWDTTKMKLSGPQRLIVKFHSMILLLLHKRHKRKALLENSYLYFHSTTSRYCVFLIWLLNRVGPSCFPDQSGQY